MGSIVFKTSVDYRVNIDFRDAFENKKYIV
jgi:hypothetical protein